jgi:signal transduction histidine kinase
MRALLAGIVLTMAMVSFGTWSALISYREFKEIATVELRLDRLSGTIVHLDEVLTMSARMAALTGEPRWEKRYRHFEDLLDAAIKETIQIAPEQRVRVAASRTDTANVKLVEMEHRSFDLVRAGRRAEAIQLLRSPAYEEQKAIYAQAIQESTDTIQQRVDERIRHHGRRTQVQLALTAVAFVAIGFGWSRLLGLVRNNVAERMRLLKQLEEAVRARDDFLSIASHELRTPLTALTLQMQSLSASRQHLERAANVPGLDGKLDIVARQVNRLSVLTDALLDISRISSGRLTLTLEDDLDLSEIVRDVIARFEGELARASCEVAVRGTAQPILGRWDRLRLEQVLGNLVANALKYGAGKPIEVEVTATAEEVRLSVRDHGIGIAPEKQAAIFDRFERAVSDRDYRGFGLGLWIVRKILTAMHGDIAVESQPGAGATFRVTIPRRAPESPSGERVPAASGLP